MADPRISATPKRAAWAPTTPNMANSDHRFMLDDLKLLDSSKYADVRVICGNRIWKLHKGILCQRCPWFEKALDGNFQEAETRSVTITEFEKDPDLINVMIRYIYSGVVDISKAVENRDGAVMATCVRLWVIADFFAFDSLQKEVIQILEDFCESHMKDLMDSKQALAVEVLQKVCKEMASGVKAAYDEFAHAKPCQKVFVDFAHVTRLRLLKASLFTTMLEKGPHGFSHDLFMSVIRGRQSKWVGRLKGDYSTFYLNAVGCCSSCGGGFNSATEWYTDPRAGHGNTKKKNVKGMCGTCAEKHGYPWQRYEKEVKGKRGRDKLRQIRTTQTLD